MDKKKNQNVRYYSVNQRGGNEAINRLVGNLNGKRLSVDPVSISRTYLETNDWRLYGAGYKLIYESEKGGKKRLLLTGLDENLVGGVVAMTHTPPLFSADLPQKTIKGKLEPLLEMRSLCLEAAVQVKAWTGAVLDDLGKTVVRLRVEESSIIPNNSRDHTALGVRICLERVRGYDKEFDEALSRLAADEEFAANAGGQMEQAFEYRGRRPLDYSSKNTIELDPSAKAWDACRLILLEQLSHMERNVEGSIKDWDSEFLHDLRVAVRRSRSLISRLKEIFPAEVLGRFSDDLSWVGSITGPTRDMDVYLLDYPKYRDSLEVGMREDLAPMHEYLVAHQKKEQRRLVRHLRASRFKNFIADWHTYLGQTQPPFDLPKAASTPIKEMASHRIWKTFRRVVREGAAIDDATPPAALHDLRKTCKKLRYLLEFFASLYPVDEVRALVKALKGLQDNLGIFQDLDVQAAALKEIGTHMMAEGDRHPETFMAMGVLIDGFMRRKAEVRTEFHDRFAAFANQENDERFRSLFEQNKIGKRVEGELE